MRLRNLYGIMLVLGLGPCLSLPGPLPAQGPGTPPAWAPSGNEAGQRTCISPSAAARRSTSSR